jgi:iron complex outermembrane receptor protein
MPKFRRRKPGLELVLVCAVSLVLSAGGLAQEVEEDIGGEPVVTDEQTPAYELSPVVVRTSRIREARDDPASFASLIRPAQFASQFRTTEDLLSRQPGVNIKRFGGLGQISTVSIRGSSAEQVLVLLDGVRLNTGAGGSVDFATVPLDSIERIEIVRGGGTAIYGSDAIGGVVNIITKAPSDKPQVSGTFTYGSHDTVKGAVTGSGAVGRLRYLLSATHFQSDGDFEYDTPEYRNEDQTLVSSERRTRINNDFQSDSVLAKADLSLTDTFEVGLLNDLFWTERGQPGTVFNERKEARQEILRNLTQIRLAKERFLVPDLEASLGGFLRYNRIDFSDPDPAIGNVPIDTKSEEYAFGAQVGATGYWEEWGSEHLVDFRGEFRQDELEDEVYEGAEGFGSQDRTSFEWHLQDEVVLLRNRLSLVPAVGFETSSDFGSHWTGKIGVIGKPRAWLTLKANYQNSFRKPNFTELYHPDQGFIRGNPDLEAEKGRNLDAGFALSFARFFLQAAYFRNWIDESIVWLPVSFFTIEPVNTGPVDAWGVELDTEYRPWIPLFLTANYTYLHAIAEETGAQLNGRPRHTVNFKASLQDELGEIFTEVQYLSDIPVRSTSTGSIEVNGRAVLDLGVTANLTALPWLNRVGWLEKCTLGLEVKNVNDASVYDALNYPLPGRMFFVTLHAVL